MDQQQDYDRFLAEFGLGKEQVRATVENEADQMPMPAGFEHVTTAPSQIHGQGVFTARAVERGQVVAPARLDGKRTPVGRYANHSRDPNVRYEATPTGDIQAIALRPIGPNEELTVDYRQAAKVNGLGLQPNADEVIRSAKLRARGGYAR